VLLSLCSRVGLPTVGQQATLIADTDGVLVVVSGMGSHQLLMARLVHLPVTRDVIVVPSEPEPRLMTGNKTGNRERLVAARSTAVDDNQINVTHLHLPSAYAALREERADDCRKYGDNELDDGLEFLKILQHGYKCLEKFIRSRSRYRSRYRYRPTF